MNNYRTFAYLLLLSVLFVTVLLLHTMKRENWKTTSTVTSSLQLSNHEKALKYGIRLDMYNEDYPEIEMSRRRIRVDRLCRHLRLNKHLEKMDLRQLNHIIVDDKHKLLYCYVAKVASTNWKRIFMILKGNLSQNPLDIPSNESHRQNQFRRLSGYSEEAIEYRLKNYLKFFFVRHPFERILSAFRNKFEKYNSYFHQRFGRVIIERFRPNATDEDLLNGNNVKFSEFVKYLLDPLTKKDGPYNEHWRPVYEMCHPCLISYDVIGKYERLNKEAEYVLQKANLSSISFPRINRTTDTLNLLGQYFGSLNNSVIFKLYQAYAFDFKMFGYKYPGFDF